MNKTTANEHPMEPFHHEEGKRSRTSGALAYLIWISIFLVFATAIGQFIAKL